MFQLELKIGLMPSRENRGCQAFNPEMLVLAREAKGWTQKELAAVLPCNQSRLSKIESGELSAQEEDIQKFQEELGQPREFFFQKEVAVRSNVSFYRKTQSLPLRLLRQCNAQMNVQRLQIERQIGSRALGVRRLSLLPPGENGGPSRVAQMVRQEWGLPSGPIRNLTQLVEEAGCVVVNFSFPSTKLDGLCVHSPDKAPVIFLNQDLPKSRRRLSLAHELGHLVMHTNPHETVEEEAWEFAGEFLMPASDIEDRLVSVDLDTLGQLKSTWGVSMQAILYRARKLNKISESYSRFLWMQLGKCGYRTNEPFEDVIPDEPTTPLNLRLKPET